MKKHLNIRSRLYPTGGGRNEPTKPIDASLNMILVKNNIYNPSVVPLVAIYVCICVFSKCGRGSSQKMIPRLVDVVTRICSILSPKF